MAEAAVRDLRIVYGMRCTWWDTIDQVGLTAPGPTGHCIPCCPHCGHLLFEVSGSGDWWAAVDRHAESNPGYRELIEWARGRCFPDMAALRAAYVEARRG